MRVVLWSLVAVLCGVMLVVGVEQLRQEADLKAREQSFKDNIAPILKARCVECHNAQKSRGSLDMSTREAALKGGDEGPAIVPFEAAKSLLISKIIGEKPEMPKKGKPLLPEEIKTLTSWVNSGAVWPKGFSLSEATAKPAVDANWWSLRALKWPSAPPLKNTAWVRTSIDRFILAKLDSVGLKPSPEADRATLVRRLSYDLHGLPPTPEQLDEVLRDQSSEWYAKLVDRLLASPRYGERWGRHWLDVAHYADTHGYDKDKRRDFAWPYRDYVIRSFNADKPYPQFVREQLAGDVLAPNSAEGVIATGFIAAGPWDFVGHVELREGTVDKMKTRLIDRDDMLASTMSTFASMTVHCARCHDHKFDPIPQTDYYRLQAVFSGVERGDRAYIPEPTKERLALEKKRSELLVEQGKLQKKIALLSNGDIERLDGELLKLRAELLGLPQPKSRGPSPSNGYHSGIAAMADVTKWVQVDLGKSHAIDEIRLFPARPVDFRDAPGFGFPARFQVAVSDDPQFKKADVIADFSARDYPNPGDVAMKLRAGGKKRRYVRVTALKLWKREEDYCFALAELQVHSGGKNVALGATVTALDTIDGGLWHRKYLVDDATSRMRLPDSTDPASMKREQVEENIARAVEQRKRLVERLLDAITRSAVEKVERELDSIDKQLTTLMMPLKVYTALPRPPRPIHVLARGDVEKPGKAVNAGALTCVPGLQAEFKLRNADNEGERRAALAEWIVDKNNPLTWRSIVNRVWHYHFGKGLVDTPNDFGGNGSKPTHPELLDWLACEFRDNGGSFKKLHRLILVSATYRQQSRHDEASAKIDGDNRWLWRMNRHRLDAESIRDSVLAVSGKLDLTMGGPGFELFRFKDDHSPIYDHTALEKIHDPKTYRRTVYRFTVRSVPNPFLDCLDCADPNINTPVRNTTLTALQALSLLNNPFMVKQSELFAERLQKESKDVDGQLERAYRLAFARKPTDTEKMALRGFVAKHGLAAACRLLFNANEFVFID